MADPRRMVQFVVERLTLVDESLEKYKDLGKHDISPDQLASMKEKNLDENRLKEAEKISKVLDQQPKFRAQVQSGEIRLNFILMYTIINELILHHTQSQMASLKFITLHKASLLPPDRQKFKIRIHNLMIGIREFHNTIESEMKKKDLTGYLLNANFKESLLTKLKSNYDIMRLFELNIDRLIDLGYGADLKDEVQTKPKQLPVPKPANNILASQLFEPGAFSKTPLNSSKPPQTSAAAPALMASNPHRFR